MPKRAPHPRQDEHADRSAHRHSPAQPWLLYAVVFMCGAILMALEIVGSRMLAPYFGNSIFVWGSLISVVLAALSLGYWLGGIMADR
jgi:predicted membrane-bound spermidine synthase